jgi:hypothetical protein
VVTRPSVSRASRLPPWGAAIHIKGRPVVPARCRRKQQASEADGRRRRAASEPALGLAAHLSCTGLPMA